MQVRHDEGVAIRIDPEPCAAVRKGDSEASVGECTGQPLSLVKIRILGADAFAKAEGNMVGRVNARVWTAQRGRRVACAEASWAGTGRSRVRTAAKRLGLHREG